MSLNSAVDPWTFRRGALVYPQPVALACGRILRESSPEKKIDAYLKASEILCRYLSALALSSLRGRDKEDFPDNVKPLEGNLAFGHYLSLLQAVSKVQEHPLEKYLSSFRVQGKGKNKKPGKADDALVSLLELRNEIGHDLNTMNTARAMTLLRQHEPEKKLADAFQSLEGILSLPLFVLPVLRLENRQIVAQRLLLMGETPDPIPDNIQLEKALEQFVPYVAINAKALMLPPVVLFRLIEEQSAYRLVFLDTVRQGKLSFKTLDSQVLASEEEGHRELMAIFNGDLSPPEDVIMPDGRTMPKEWAEERKVRETAGKSSEGVPVWDDYDATTLDWYANQLVAEDSQSSVNKIVKHLLDGRTRGLTQDEIRQLLLLFGKEKNVRASLGREVYDFRTIRESGQRWDQRIMGSQNILNTLKLATEFLAAHILEDSVEAADLTRRSGSADYIAMREALVNQFIHQDFSDNTAAAQIELKPERAMFFNTGFSLITEEHLSVGGRSQSRNPLIARALRLIGYAELAGGGLRALQYEWRKVRRRPPVIESDTGGNTFTLSLDWREVPDAYDTVWKDKIGVELTSNQAAVLNLATDEAGISLQQAAAGTEMDLTEVEGVLRFLARQVLIEERNERYYLQEHLKELI